MHLLITLEKKVMFDSASMGTNLPNRHCPNDCAFLLFYLRFGSRRTNLAARVSQMAHCSSNFPLPLLLKATKN